MKKHNIPIILLVILLASVWLGGCQGTDESTDTATGDAAIIDLSGLSTTMLKGELFKIMTNGADYVGQTIKMDGFYYRTGDEGADAERHFVIVEIADPCCMQGLEFNWSAGGMYPTLYDEIAVTGVFSSYEKQGLTFYYLDTEDFPWTDKT